MLSGSRPRKRAPGFAGFARHDRRPSRPCKSKRPRKPLIPEVVAAKPTQKTEAPAPKEEKPSTASPPPAPPLKPRLAKRVAFSQLPPPTEKASAGKRRGRGTQRSSDFPDVDWMSNSTKRRGLGADWKERSLDYQAHRTMNALLLRREQDVTRHIAIQGDSGVNRLAPSSTTSRLGNLRLWPNSEYYRIAGHESIAKYQCLGLDLQDSRFIDICLEEPGMEWDARELRCAEEGSDAELDAHVDIADAEANGGIGLVIQDSDGPCVLTKQQLMHPHLQAPRYGRIPLDRHKLDLSEYQPIADMLRAQLGALQGPPAQAPLSAFVSRTIAEEAVLGAAKTWAKIKHFRTDADGSLRKRLGASSNISQWIGVLDRGPQLPPA
ncbi:hypothetical protein BX667DRAFT_531331 [Coemansia mojavensis]|nr:hypothetical protein BX667DRAFT_531331 [Coemansia mojavensis]KAJ1742859.1 hypothetical protein LPJ68_001561 [Coemansia sp. RSA 1086]